MFYHVIILTSLDERRPLVQGYTHHSDTQCNEKTSLFLKKKRAIMICKKVHAKTFVLGIITTGLYYLVTRMYFFFVPFSLCHKDGLFLSICVVGIRFGKGLGMVSKTLSILNTGI